MCTTMLGFVETYPLYVVGGIWLAMPTLLLTIALVLLLSVSIANYRLGCPIPNQMARALLAFAILFSLPFGLLSLPLFFKISTKGRRIQK